jgi:putative CocE/NonD family hydrolase
MAGPRTVKPPLVDRVFARRAGLQKPRPWRVETVRIPAPDGAGIGADIYTPLDRSKGVLLARGPYGRGGMLALGAARMYAAQGYTVLFASTRGTADSGGVLDPMRDEVADGRAIVTWMRGQPWYQGRFATVGASYLGYTQWALLSDPPEDLVTSVITMGPHDFSQHAWGTGTFNLDLLGWADTVQATQQGPLTSLFKLASAPRRLAPVYRSVPVVAGADRHFSSTAPWLRERLLRPDLADSFWAPMRQSAALDKAAVPVLIQAGWQDIFLRQSMTQYARLRARGVPVAITVGAWTHLDVGFAAQQVLAPETLAWLGHYLAGEPAAPRTAPVRVQAGGSGKWLELAEWPPPGTATTFYLHGDGRLAAEEPPAADGPRSFTFDPGNPTPAVGGNKLGGGGYKDDSELARRQDVLSYETSPLAADLTVMGSARLTLAHAMERPDGDLFVRVSDIDAAGRPRNVAETYQRVRGEEPDVTLELLPAAHTFAAGHRIRLLIAGGSFPQFARSSGTGDNPLTAAALHANKHTVRHAAGSSALQLPVAG